MRCSGFEIKQICRIRHGTGCREQSQPKQTGLLCSVTWWDSWMLKVLFKKKLEMQVSLLCIREKNATIPRRTTDLNLTHFCLLHFTGTCIKHKLMCRTFRSFSHRAVCDSYKRSCHSPSALLKDPFPRHGQGQGKATGQTEGKQARKR